MLTYCDYCLCVCVQRHALKPEMEMLLLETASQCKAVICCRVTPLQKVREREKVIMSLFSLSLSLSLSE